ILTQYQNTGSFVIPHAGTIAAPFQATVVGASGNTVGPGQPYTNWQIIQNTLAGVQVTNPVIGATGTWLTTTGNNQETDAALVFRCQNRWPALGVGKPAGYYSSIIQTAVPNITRILVEASQTQVGTVNVWCGQTAGASPSTDVANALAAILPVIPLTTSVSVQPVTTITITVAGTVYYNSSLTSATAVASTALGNLTAYIQGATIGTTTGNTKVYLSEIITALGKTVGVTNVVLTSPLTDTALADGQMAVMGSTAGITFSPLTQ